MIACNLYILGRATPWIRSESLSSKSYLRFQDLPCPIITFTPFLSQLLERRRFASRHHLARRSLYLFGAQPGKPPRDVIAPLALALLSRKLIPFLEMLTLLSSSRKLIQFLKQLILLKPRRAISLSRGAYFIFVLEGAISLLQGTHFTFPLEGVYSLHRGHYSIFALKGAKSLLELLVLFLPWRELIPLFKVPSTSSSSRELFLFLEAFIHLRTQGSWFVPRVFIPLSFSRELMPFLEVLIPSSLSRELISFLEVFVQIFFSREFLSSEALTSPFSSRDWFPPWSTLDVEELIPFQGTFDPQKNLFPLQSAFALEELIPFSKRPWTWRDDSLFNMHLPLRS